MSEESKEAELVPYAGRMMYPEVAEYFRIGHEAHAVMDAAEGEASHVYNQASRAAKLAHEQSSVEMWDQYRATRRNGLLYEANRIHEEAHRAAREAYQVAVEGRRAGLRASTHPEVRWIEANALNDEQGYAEIVLKHLPVADSSVLWELKDKYGMCREFDRLFAEAELDGAFNDGKASLGARELIALRNWINRNWGGSYSSQVTIQLQPYVKAVAAAQEEAVAKAVAEARAEWQKLDEARAENATHNRSQAQKAAWERRRAEQEVIDRKLVEDTATPMAQEIPQISTQSAMTGEIIRSDIRPTFESVSEISDRVNA